MNVLLGTPAAGGINIGSAFILPEQQERKIPKHKIKSQDLESEWARFEDALKLVSGEVSQHLAQVDKKNVQYEILQTYSMMLSDTVFMTEFKTFFEQKLFNVEYSLNYKVQEYADRLRSSGNDYLAERSQDIEDIFDHVLNILLGYQPFDIEQIPDGAVIVGRTLRTSDTVILAKRKIKGIAITEGGPSSHVAILSKGYGIPCVCGIEDVASLINQDETVVVDGNIGEVICSPDTATLIATKSKIAAEEKYRENLAKFKDLPAKTDDGTIFHLYANIGTPEEAKVALDNGADGIGLFRTEFLFMNALSKQNKEGGSFSNSLTEEAQFQAYKQVLEIMGDRPVTIRTLDAGGDKLIDAKEFPNLTEKNPLMGLRAIRLSLYTPSVFRTQLRALYRASVYGNLKILLPLITDVSQVETAMGIARGVQMSLKADNIPFNPDVPIGVMVETAAAAICSDCLAPKAAFFSLGTNDLTQYTLGVDRENKAVAPLYNEFSLAVLRMIEMTIYSAEKNRIDVSVCGEMAGNKESAIILAGMGIRSLSMAPNQIPIIKETLSRFTIDELSNLSNRSLF